MAASAAPPASITDMTAQRTVHDVLEFKSKAAQCPSCFTFNHPEYLPDQKKQVLASGLMLTCAVCGALYLGSPRQAA
jgi:hypothetical protein